MDSQTIFIIRHAEKPAVGGQSGVDEMGSADHRSLTPRGWQRAGAWAELLVPALTPGALPKPGALFASAPAGSSTGDDEGGSKSRRPLETLTPLAEKLGIAINLKYTKGDEVTLAQAISQLSGVVLVCWQHEDIVAIATALQGTSAGLPGKWPGDRFNVILKFDRSGGRASWSFKQIVPIMLSGDKPQPI